MRDRSPPLLRWFSPLPRNLLCGYRRAPAYARCDRRPEPALPAGWPQPTHVPVNLRLRRCECSNGRRQGGWDRALSPTPESPRFPQYLPSACRPDATGPTGGGSFRFPRITWQHRDRRDCLSLLGAWRRDNLQRLFAGRTSGPPESVSPLPECRRARVRRHCRSGRQLSESPHAPA